MESKCLNQEEIGKSNPDAPMYSKVKILPSTNAVQTKVRLAKGRERRVLVTSADGLG